MVNVGIRLLYHFLYITEEITEILSIVLLRIRTAKISTTRAKCENP